MHRQDKVGDRVLSSKMYKRGREKEEPDTDGSVVKSTHGLLS